VTGIASRGDAEDPRPVKVGEWLADAGAFDAGGADALWIDLGPQPELDVLALAAALAVVPVASSQICTQSGTL
jgi:hypothetical protein